MTSVLDRLDALLREATPGDFDSAWEATDGDVWNCQPDGRGGPMQVLLASTTAHRAPLIAEAISALPALLAIARAAERVEKMFEGVSPDETDAALKEFRAALSALEPKP